MTFNIKTAKQLKPGIWRPDIDPSLLPLGDYAELYNFRYDDEGLSGVNGYRKINTTALTDAEITNGFNYKKDYPSESYIFVREKDSSNNYALKINKGTIPDPANFESGDFYDETTAATALGKILTDENAFASVILGNMVYCNGVENLIYGGDEMPLGALFISASAINNTLANTLDSTQEINNTLKTTDQVVTIGGSNLYGIIGSTRPIKAVNFYLSSVNATPATLSFEQWNGTAWVAVSNPVDNTSGLQQEGQFAFDTTVGVSVIKNIEYLALYFYRFNLSAGSADVYNMTLEIPVQPMIDVWDGIGRQPIQFQVEKTSVWTDYTIYVREASQPDFPIAADISSLAATDQIIVIFSEALMGIRWEMLSDNINKNASVATIKYWNGIAWAAVTGFTDTTIISGKTLNTTGYMSWQPIDIGTEYPKTQFGVSGYAYQITFSATLSGADVLVDTITGITTPIKIPPYKFAVNYNNRVFLCRYDEGGESNRIKYSSKNATEVFNGTESDDLFIGTNTKLTCATTLYNRYGANIFATLILLKQKETFLLNESSDNKFDIYPISNNYGCPAPYTLDTAELGFEFSKDITRNIAIWLSHAGLIVFDGALILPVTGISNFFDTSQPECINHDYIHLAAGKYDSVNLEYNLLIPSGSSATANNKWLVYSFLKKAWFEKKPPIYPQNFIKVNDNNGISYLYGCMADGYMMRLDYGTYWDVTDSDDQYITQYLKTGDFLPSNNMWDTTRMNYFKYFVKRVDDQDLSNASIFKHYRDTSETGTTLPDPTPPTNLNIPDSRVLRFIMPNIEKIGVHHAFSVQGKTRYTEDGFQVLGMGYQYDIMKDDL